MKRVNGINFITVKKDEKRRISEGGGGGNVASI